MSHSELPISIFCVGHPCSKNPREETKNELNMLVLTIILLHTRGGIIGSFAKIQGSNRPHL